MNSFTNASVLWVSFVFASIVWKMQWMFGPHMVGLFLFAFLLILNSIFSSLLVVVFCAPDEINVYLIVEAVS